MDTCVWPVLVLAKLALSEVWPVVRPLHQDLTRICERGVISLILILPGGAGRSNDFITPLDEPPRFSMLALLIGISS